MLLLEAIEYLFAGLALLSGQVTSISLLVGSVVGACGLMVLMWCAGHARPGKIEGGDVSGPWRFVRHPEISARFLMIFGMMLVARVPWLYAVAILVLGFFYRRMVSQGDNELRKWLGPSFAMYRLLTPSFLPQFMPAKLPQHTMRVSIQDSPWSFKRVSRRIDFLWVAGLYVGTICWLVLCFKLDASHLFMRLAGVGVVSRSFWCFWFLLVKTKSADQTVFQRFESLQKFWR